MEYAVSVLLLGLSVFALVCGAVLLRRRRGPAGAWPGAFALVLFLAGAAWAAPRVLRPVLAGEPTLWLGLGRLLAALALTAAYLLLYRIWELVFRPKVRDRTVFWTLCGFTLFRLLLLLLPQNGWTDNSLPVFWVTLRTAALAGAAAPVVVSYRAVRGENRALSRLWLWELLSLLLLLPAALGAVPLPELLFAASALCRAGTLICFLRFTK